MSEPNMFSKHDMYTQIELLKKEVQDMKGISTRLDTAIVKIGDVSNSINRMLAVHEEKISQQKMLLIRSDAEFSECKRVTLSYHHQHKRDDTPHVRTTQRTN